MLHTIFEFVYTAFLVLGVACAMAVLRRLYELPDEYYGKINYNTGFAKRQ